VISLPDQADAMAWTESALGTEAHSIRQVGGESDQRVVYRVDTSTGPITVKGFRVPPPAATFVSHERLHTALGSNDVIRIPRALACSGAFVAYEWIDGTPIASSGSYVLAGRALAALHAVEPESIGLTEETDMARHIEDLVKPHPLVLASSVPDAAPIVERALDFLRESPGGPTAVLHRDFHSRQLIEEPDRVAVIDWDLLAAGDPAFDVAYMVTYLETHSIPFSAEFLDGYGDQSVRDRIDRYRVFNLVRRACRRFRLRDEGWEAEMWRMLAMADQALR